MTDAHTQNLAKKCLQQLEELVLLGKLQTSQLTDIRTHLEPLARPAPPPVVGRKPPAVPRNVSLCKALWDYSGAEADELTFKEGDRIELIEEVDAAWWRGQVMQVDGGHSQAGLFPSNYVEKVQPNASELLSPTPPPPPRNLPPIYTPPQLNNEHISNQPSTYGVDEKQQMQGYHNSGSPMNMPSPYGQPQNGPQMWQPDNARWASGAPPAMPPPPSPQPPYQNQYGASPQPPPSPAPSNQSYYSQNQQIAAQAPGNPAQYGTTQPVPADPKKNDKLKKFGGRMGQTLATSFVGGVGFGVGSHLIP